MHHPALWGGDPRVLSAAHAREGGVRMTRLHEPGALDPGVGLCYYRRSLIKSGGHEAVGHSDRRSVTSDPSILEGAISRSCDYEVDLV